MRRRKPSCPQWLEPHSPEDLRLCLPGTCPSQGRDNSMGRDLASGVMASWLLGDGFLDPTLNSQGESTLGLGVPDGSRSWLLCTWEPGLCTCTAGVTRFSQQEEEQAGKEPCWSQVVCWGQGRGPVPRVGEDVQAWMG